MPYHINEELSDVIFEVEGDKVAFKVPMPSSGINSEELWNLLGKQGTEQIDISHIKDALDSYFEGGLSGDSYLELDENGNVRVKDGRNFYTEGELSAGGFSSEGGGGDTGGGIDENKLWEILGKEGTQQIDASHLQDALSQFTPDLSNYVTNEALASTLKGYATSEALNTHASDTNLHLSEEDREKLSWFAKDEQGNIYIKGGLNFYTEGEISAGGYSDEGGTEPGGGGIDETKLWQILGNDGTEQIAKNHLTTALSDYITASSANSLFATKTELSNYATSSDLAQINSNVTAISTKLDDFLEGSDTDTIINKWKELEAFLSGMSESDNLADILAIKADTTWVTEQLSTKLDKTVFDDLFEKVLISDGKYAIRAKYDFYSEGEISAGGYSDEGGGTGVGSLLGIKVNGSTYAPVDGYITIPDYPTELSWGAITGKPTTLAGYGITDAYTKAESDDRFLYETRYTLTDDVNNIPIQYPRILEVNKYANVPTSNSWHQIFNWGTIDVNYGFQMAHAYTIQNGELFYRTKVNGEFGSWIKFLTSNNYASTLDTRYVKKSGDTMTGVLTINNSNQYSLSINSSFSFETAINLLRNGTSKGVVGYHDTQGTYLYNRKSGKFIANRDDGNAYFDNNKIWHAGNDGAGSGLDADLLDGYHESSFLRHRANTATNGENTLWSQIGMKQYNNALPDGLSNTYKYGVVVTFASTNNRLELYCSHVSSEGTGSDRGLYFRSGYNDDKKAWRRLATVDDNVASATKLQTPRTIWGQSFDGTNNISGELSGCTRIYNAVNNPIVLGNSNNSSWVYTQDIASAGGQGYWAINTVGHSWFKKANIGYTYANEGSFPLNVQGTISSTSLSTQNIRIECDNNGVLGSRGSEINNYNNVLYLQHNTSNNLVMCSGGGNVGIGTNSPGFKVDIVGSVRCQGEWFRTTGNTGWYSETYSGGIHMTDNTWVRIYNKKSLYVTGTIFADGYNNHGNNYGYIVINKLGDYYAAIGGNGAIDEIKFGKSVIDGAWVAGNINWRFEGNIVATGEVTAGSSSDARLKNILGKQDYAKRLLDLGMVVDYTYNDLAFSRNVRSIERRAYTGLIYQNVKKVLPQMAGEDADGYGYLNYIHTDYINLIAGALQQTILKQETIEQRVTRLERENAELKQKIAKLAA